MAVTVASLVAKLGYDDGDFQKGLDGSESRLGKFGGVASAAMKLGVTSVAAGVAAVAASTMSMQDALTPVMTLTGAGTQQFKDMSAAISDVVRTSPKSADEIGNSAYMILSAGITDTAKAQQTLIDSNNLALAGLGSVPDATNLVTSAMNSWKDANLSSTDAAQILFGTIAAGKTTTTELAQGFGGIAPLASSLGVDFKSLMAATAALTATGMPAAQAYSGMKAAFANILKPTADASKAAAQLGIDFSASALKTKGLKGFLDDVGHAAGGNTQVLADMFGSIEAGNAVMALTGPQAQAFADNFGVIDEKGKNLSQTAKDVSNTFSNRIKIMKNSAMVSLSEIGNKGLDWLSAKWKEWGPTITKVMDEVKTGIKQAITGISQGWQGLDPGAGASGVQRAFWAIGQFAQGAWQTIKIVFGEIKGGFVAFVAAFKAGDGDITSAGFPGFMERVGFIVREIWNWIKDNWPAIKDTFMTVFNAVSDWIVTNGPTIRDGYISVFNAIKDIVTDVVAKIQEYWPQIVTVFQAAAEVIGPIADFLVTMWRFQMEELGRIWNNGGKQIVDVVFWVFGVITPAIEGALHIIRDIFKTVTDLMKGNWGDAWHDFTQIFVDWWSAFWGTFVNVWNALTGFASTLWNMGVGLINGLIGGIFATIGSLWSWLNGLPNSLLVSIGDLGSLLWNAGVNLINGLIGGIFSKFGAVKDALGNLTGKLTSWKGPEAKDKRILRGSGQMVLDGFMAGLNDRMPAIQAQLGAFTASLSGGGSTVNNIGAPGSVVINMPQGANGNDVVRALKDWQRINGRVPITVGG